MNDTEQTPRFSVVIAAKDYGRFLGQAIESVLCQTLHGERCELIVVDDGSTDDTREVVERFGSQVRYIYQENRGQGAALNTGFRASLGELIVLLDADDTFYPTKLAELIARFEADPEVGMVHHRLDVVNERGDLLHTTPFRRRLDEGFLRDQLIRYGGTWNAFTTTATSALAFRRSALERILPIPEPDFRTMADGYLVTQAALVAPVGAIHRSLGSYRMHGKNNWAPTELTSEWLQARLLAPLARVSDLVGERVVEQTAGQNSRSGVPPLPIKRMDREKAAGRRFYFVRFMVPMRAENGVEAALELPVRVTDDRLFMEYRCLAERMDGNLWRSIQSYGLLGKALWRDRRVSAPEKFWRMLSVFTMLAMPAASYTRLRHWYSRNNFLFALRKKIFAPKEGALAHGSV